MNRWYKLFLILPIIIIGCKNKEIDEKYLSQSINSLNMNIFSKEGEKLISIKSPYSKYDKEKNSFDLKETTINLFKDNNVEYIINSDNSKLSNNNKFLELYAKKTVENYLRHFNSYELDLAANVILSLAINTNLYLNEKQPWTLIKDEKNIPFVSNIIYLSLIHI